MKNTKVYPNDWLQLHPYKKSDPIDLYYTNIANQIYEIIEKTGLVYSFEGNETRQISTRMAAYFEDVISQINIWRTFITTYKEIFGKYLPFYTPDDHYYEDEVNLEDIQFLLWHYTQQYHGYRKGTFVNPENATIKETSKLIYQLFCDEWTVAPENEKLQELFSPKTSYKEPYRYEDMLFWFHYNSYLFTDHDLELTDYVTNILRNDTGSGEEANQIIIRAHQYLAYTNKTALLALTSPEWLYRILPSTHPDADYFEKIAKNSVEAISEEIKQKNVEYYEKFTKEADGKLLIYTNDFNELKSLIKEKLCIPSEHLEISENLRGKKIAISATPEDGVQIIMANVESIKDKNNPFFDENIACEKGVYFYIVKHCSANMLKILEEKGLLADTQIKSTISPEQGKTIIHDNWQFLSRYFIREYPI